VAERILNMIEAVTPPVWEVLLSALKVGPVTVRTAVLIVLMRLASRSSRVAPVRLTPERWAQAAEVLSGLGRAELPDAVVMLSGPPGLTRAAAGAAGTRGAAVDRAVRSHPDQSPIRLNALLPPRPPLPSDGEGFHRHPEFPADTPAADLL